MSEAPPRSSEPQPSRPSASTGERAAKTIPSPQRGLRVDHTVVGVGAHLGADLGAPKVPVDDVTLADDDLQGERFRALVTRLPVVDPKSYRVTGEVGQGGIGRVLEARSVSLDRPVALKELRSAGPTAEERFIREALLTARLQHPAIVPLYEAGRWPSGEPFYTMKYVSGRSFEQVILEGRSLFQRLGLLPHVLAVAEAVAYAHSERIIHRDLKPSNVLIGPFGETVVIDWGLAKDLAQDAREAADSLPSPLSLAEPPGEGDGVPSHRADRVSAPKRPVEALTMHGAVMGTPAYMPPEQALGNRVDERADVYALGAILYHVLAGTCPYEGDTAVGVLRKVIASKPPALEERQKGIPQDLLTIVNKAMARDPEGRYPTAKELADDLRRFQTGQIVAAHRYSTVERMRRFVRRHSGAAAVAALAFVLLAVTLGLSFRDNLGQRYRAEAGEAAALAAKQQAVARADDLTLVEARAASGRDPNEALAWLKSLSPSFDRWPEARLIAAEARARGVATVLRGHSAVINDAVFSPRGEVLVTTSDDHTARVWEIATGAVHVLSGHTDEVFMASFSPSGARLATSSKDKTIRLWDARTHALLRVLSGHEGSAVRVFFADENTLASDGYDQTVRLWDLDTGESRIVAADAQLRGSPISAGGRFLALSGGDGTIRVYDRARDETRRFPGSQSPILATAISPAGDAVVTQSEDGSMRRWDLRSGASSVLRASGRRRLSGTLKNFRASPDGELVATGSAGTEVLLWDLPTGVSRVFSGHEGHIGAVAFSADSKLLATGSFDHTVRIWDLATGAASVLRGFKDVVSVVTFSPDGALLASASADHTVRLFPVKEPSEGVLEGHLSPPSIAAYSPDGERLLVGAEDGEAWIWEMRGLARFDLVGHTGGVVSAIFSPNGERVATASRDGTVRVWDREGRTLARVDVDIGSLEGQGSLLAFSPDSRLLAAPGLGLTAQIIDLTSGALRALSEPLTGAARRPVRGALSVAFSPDGERLAVGSADALVRVWDLATSACRVLSIHDRGVTAVAFSPDGETLASGGEDHALIFWDMRSGARRRVDVSGGGVLQLAFTPSGDQVVTLSRSETGVRLWDVETGAALRFLSGHGGSVNAFSLAPDGRRLATASVDGTVRIWDMASGESRALRGHGGAVKSAAFSPDGMHLASGSEDRTVRLWTDDLPESESALRAWIDAATPDTIADVRRR